MKISETGFKDLLIIEPDIWHDGRGYFFESYNHDKYPPVVAQCDWVQDNESKSERGVLRGLHYQTGKSAQAKLVRAVMGEIFDVAVDLRPDASTYGKWYGLILSSTNKKQLFIPRGFAHGFLVLSKEAIFSYKCDNYYSKSHEAGIIYNDVQLAIDWPLDDDQIVISQKDKFHPLFENHRAS